MKIVVFGPTGMVGSRIVAELEQRGHEVAGASRSGGTDVTDPGSVASAAAGADAVVCAVSARGVGYTLADVARSLVDGVRRAGARRVVTVGGTGSLEVAPGVRYVDTPGFNDEYKPEALQHAEALEVYRGIERPRLDGRQPGGVHPSGGAHWPLPPRRGPDAPRLQRQQRGQRRGFCGCHR
jgi:hypothetical protein